MKKLLVIITLITSSFFFVDFVKAYEFEVQPNLDLINDEFFLFKEKVEEFINSDITYSDNYFIYMSGSSYYGAILPLEYDYTPVCNFYSSSVVCLYNSSGKNTDRLELNSNGNIVVSGTASNKKNIYSSSSFNPIIYSNFKFLMWKDSYNSSLTYKIDNFSLSNFADGESSYYTLYDIYQEYQKFLGSSDLDHENELKLLSNFYTLCIEKINYLVDVIINNYIYLSIIVIFILIFIFKLIFRRLL